MGDRAFRSLFFMLDYGIHTEKIRIFALVKRRFHAGSVVYANT